MSSMQNEVRNGKVTLQKDVAKHGSNVVSHVQQKQKHMPQQ